MNVSVKYLFSDVSGASAIPSHTIPPGRIECRATSAEDKCMKAPFLIGPTLLGGFFFTTESITCRRPNPWRPTQNRKEYPPLSQR